MSLTRRTFLGGCTAGLAAFASGRVFALSLDPNAQQSSDDLFVLVFLRGGIDGLHLMAPVDDPNYVAARTAQLRLNDSGDHNGVRIERGTPAGGDWRIHPAAQPLLDLYQSGDMACLHAAGLTHGTRSHFEAMDLVERGVPELEGGRATDGWLTRLFGGQTEGVIPLVAASDRIPSSLMGTASAVAVRNLPEFRLWAGDAQERFLELAWAGEDPIRAAGRTALQSIQAVQAALPRNDSGEVIPYRPEGGAQYPDSDFSRGLQSVAQLAKMDVGLKAAAVDIGGWDTHEYQSYKFPRLVEDLSRSLHAFYTDMGRFHGKMTVLVLSEFGRRLRANQSDGTDHGYGNVMMVLGKHVAGGRIHGRWPGLETEQLDQRADLAITTDYRQVVAEIARKRLGWRQDVDRLFPGFAEAQDLGIITA